jgi:hypothetical protein
MRLVANPFDGEINANYPFYLNLFPDGRTTQAARFLSRPTRQKARAGAGPDAD